MFPVAGNFCCLIRAASAATIVTYGRVTRSEGRGLRARMKILRNRCWLAVLTLIAFSVQLAVAASHHHHEVNRGSGIAARAITAGLCAPLSKRPCDPDRGQHSHDGCVLCWASAIAQTSLEPPSLPQISAPPLEGGARFDTRDVAAVDLIHRDHFQARGPPEADDA